MGPHASLPVIDDSNSSPRAGSAIKPRRNSNSHANRSNNQLLSVHVLVYTFRTKDIEEVLPVHLH